MSNVLLAEGESPVEMLKGSLLTEDDAEDPEFDFYDEDLESLVDQESEAVDAAASDDPDRAGRRRGRRQYQPFNYGVKGILRIDGRIYEDLEFRYKVSAFGATVRSHRSRLTPSGWEVCQSHTAGKLLGLQYCLYTRRNALYIRGTLKAWFKVKESWNQRIISLPR